MLSHVTGRTLCPLMSDISFVHNTRVTGYQWMRERYIHLDWGTRRRSWWFCWSKESNKKGSSLQSLQKCILSYCRMWPSFMKQLSTAKCKILRIHQQEIESTNSLLPTAEKPKIKYIIILCNLQWTTYKITSHLIICCKKDSLSPHVWYNTRMARYQWGNDESRNWWFC